MSLRELVDPECGGANPLMRLGTHIVSDTALKDEGISGRTGIGAASTSQSQAFGGEINENHLVNEFLGQMGAPPPQTFRMDALLQEMREMDAQNYPRQVVQAPPVSAEVNSSIEWANEFHDKDLSDLHKPTQPSASLDATDPTQQTRTDTTHHTFWQNQSQHPSTRLPSANMFYSTSTDQSKMPLTTGDFFDDVKLSHQQHTTDPESASFIPYFDSEKVWANELSKNVTEAGASSTSQPTQEADWVKDFAEQKAKQDIDNEQFNKQFWDRLQDEWKKLSEQQDEQSPYLQEFSEFYDPYKEYVFDEENPMLNVENAFEKGKAFLEIGDIPSAVLCFEAAVRQDENNAEIWELLGTSQAENEKDPNAIAALKKSLELNANNRNVMMALAISYTNESLQNQALRMLIDWLRTNEKYKNIMPAHFHQDPGAVMASSLINGPELKDVQDLFIQAVQQNPNDIDADIQEALGVLFNLSAEYEKAADCFRAALQVKPNSAKIWNRLGASLANGNQSVAAVEAYHHALAIEPGYIRARYNVGIICINLKAYNEAVEHFLTALNHQATSMARSGLQSVRDSSNQMSDTIWSTLRMAISLMGRMDLQQAIDDRDLDTLNKVFKTTE